MEIQVHYTHVRERIHKKHRLAFTSTVSQQETRWRYGKSGFRGSSLWLLSTAPARLGAALLLAPRLGIFAKW